jgi:hypothetical protein
MSIEVRFQDGSTGEVEIDDHEYVILMDYARRGIRITLPVGVNGTLFYINIVDVRKVVRPEINLDRTQLSKLGAKFP